jgi:hypothetical protein
MRAAILGTILLGFTLKNPSKGAILIRTAITEHNLNAGDGGRHEPKQVGS